MSAPHRYRTIADLPSVIPVFPLPGALLLPRSRLPLNIFEPRYLQMVDHAMDGYRLIGMVQPKDANADLMAAPALADVGCAGRIVDYSEMDNGHYQITLLGIARFQIAGERDAAAAFREVAADYHPYADDLSTAPDPPIARDRLMHALKPYLKDRAMQTDWKSIEEAPSEALVNALSILCPFDPKEKQALLEAPTLKERADALITLLEFANAGSGGARGGQPLH
jgi:Lon protease-like protein